MAIDLVAEDNPAFCGRPGVYGQRAANIIQQKADTLYVFGARLDNEQVAHRIDNFAPRAYKVIYDIDQAELDKLPSTHKSEKDKRRKEFWDKEKIDLSKPYYVQLCKAGMSEYLGITPETDDTNWLSWCKALYNRFRPELEGKVGDYIDPFYFQRILSDMCQPDDVLAIGSSGGAPNSFLQTFKVKQGQRIVNCSTIGAMGIDIPAAIGACIGSGGRRTICVTGDGGFMLNIQELEVVRRLNLPIKFFVFNNYGYGSIRNMQNARFEGRHVGCDPESGLTLPDIGALAEAFEIPFSYVTGHLAENNTLSPRMNLLIENDSPIICEVMIDPNYQQYPRVSSTGFQADAMEDMTPRLPADELKEIMDYGNN
jgi:acetolactate synthase-1/2/3 large subunit